MCGFMCMLSLAGYLPYIWLITLPLYASFCGVDAAIRLSLVMSLFAVTSEIGPKFLEPIQPFVNFAVFFVLLSMPVGVVPAITVFIYKQALWILEPLFLLVETFQIVKVYMAFSSTCSVSIEEYPTTMKVFILSLSGISYVLACKFAYSVWTSSASALMLWLLLALVALSVMAHVCMYAFDEGIVSDAAITTAMSFCLLYAARQEMLYVESPVTERPAHWDSSAYLNTSFFQLLVSMSRFTMDHMQLSAMFLRKLVSPLQVALIMVRLHGVLSLFRTLSKKSAEEADEEEPASVWERMSICGITVKLSAIFVYTQMVSSHLHKMFSGNVWTQGIGRLLQSLGIPIVYMYLSENVERNGWNRWNSCIPSYS